MNPELTNIPNLTSSDSQWIQWHGLLRSTFGKKGANDIFEHAWNKRRAEGNMITGSSANTVRLRNYMKEQGVTISPEGYLDYAAGFVDNVSGSVSWFFGFSRTLSVIVIALILIILFVALMNIARNSDKIVSGAINAKGGLPA